MIDSFVSFRFVLFRFDSISFELSNNLPSGYTKQSTRLNCDGQGKCQYSKQFHCFNCFFLGVLISFSERVHTKIVFCSVPYFCLSRVRVLSLIESNQNTLQWDNNRTNDAVKVRKIPAINRENTLLLYLLQRTQTQFEILPDNFHVQI